MFERHAEPLLTKTLEEGTRNPWGKPALIEAPDLSQLQAPENRRMAVEGFKDEFFALMQQRPIVEEGVRRVVALLNAHNLTTVQACEGHHQTGRSIPWIMVEAPYYPEKFVGQQEMQRAELAKAGIDPDQFARDEIPRFKGGNLTSQFGQAIQIVNQIKQELSNNLFTVAFRAWESANNAAQVKLFKLVEAFERINVAANSELKLHVWGQSGHFGRIEFINTDHNYDLLPERRNRLVQFAEFLESQLIVPVAEEADRSVRFEELAKLSKSGGWGAGVKSHFYSGEQGEIFESFVKRFLPAGDVHLGSDQDPRVFVRIEAPGRPEPFERFVGQKERTIETLHENGLVLEDLRNSDSERSRAANSIDFRIRSEMSRTHAMTPESLNWHIASTRVYQTLLIELSEFYNQCDYAADVGLALRGNCGPGMENITIEAGAGEKNMNGKPAERDFDLIEHRRNELKRFAQFLNRTM